MLLGMGSTKLEAIPFADVNHLVTLGHGRLGDLRLKVQGLTKPAAVSVTSLKTLVRDHKRVKKNGYALKDRCFIRTKVSARPMKTAKHNAGRAFAVEKIKMGKLWPDGRNRRTSSRRSLTELCLVIWSPVQ